MRSGTCRRAVQRQLEKRPLTSANGDAAPHCAELLLFADLFTLNPDFLAALQRQFKLMSVLPALLLAPRVGHLSRLQSGQLPPDKVMDAVSDCGKQLVLLGVDEGHQDAIHFAENYPWLVSHLIVNTVPDSQITGTSGIAISAYGANVEQAVLVLLSRYDELPKVQRWFGRSPVSRSLEIMVLPGATQPFAGQDPEQLVQIIHRFCCREVSDTESTVVE